MSIRIKRTRVTSPSAQKLKESLLPEVPNTKLLSSEWSTWRGTGSDLLINWGCSKPINSNVNAVVFNKPEAIKLAANKLKTFKALDEAEVDIPWYTEGTVTSMLPEIAARSMEEDRLSFMFRTTATGYGGEGIYVIENLYDKACEYFGMLCDAQEVLEYLVHLKNNHPDYSFINDTEFVTQYFKAKNEYRIHVACDNVIFCQRKALRTDEDRPIHPDFMVRNHENGFIFQQNNIEVPEEVKLASIKAVKALGLDFGAVDIKAKTNRGEVTYNVLEVNTAPGVTGNTLKTYTDTFKSIHDVLNSD